MFFEFGRYFFRYIFVGKNKQRLLLLSIFGLFISTFALLVLQSTMGGLQNNQIQRIKHIQGDGVIYLKDKTYDFYQEILNELQKSHISSTGEYEIELMLRNKSYVSPIVLHGIDNDNGREIPEFLKDIPLTDLVLPMDLSIKLGAQMGDSLQIIALSHVDTFLSDIPRSTQVYLDYVFSTNVPEIDSFHAWTNIKTIWNLVRKKEVNQIRVYKMKDQSALKDLVSKYDQRLYYNSFADENKTLTMALNLETTVMIFLFVAMTMLVSLCITSGLMIFLGKIKNDLASFWILGASQKKLENTTYQFLGVFNLITVVLGLLCGLGFLYLLERYGVEIMPDVFVDRKIPIHITPKGILISLCIPYFISMFFSIFSLNQFKKEVDYLDFVRSIG